jgi:hypothetical protein
MRFGKGGISFFGGKRGFSERFFLGLGMGALENNPQALKETIPFSLTRKSGLALSQREREFFISFPTAAAPEKNG